MEEVVNMALYEKVSNQEMRQDFCEYCGRTGCVFETHHIKTKGSGGGEERANKINLCIECHDKAQTYVVQPWELIVRVAHREKCAVCDVYLAIGWPLPENVDELESMLRVPQPMFEPLENLVSILVSSEETQTELEFFRGRVVDVMVHMGCTLGWIASNIGKSTSYVRQRLVTYRVFPNEDDRARDLSWTHHRIAAMAESDKSPREWIDEAVNNQYSTRQMAQAVRGDIVEKTPNSWRIKAEKVLGEVNTLLSADDGNALWLCKELQKLIDGLRKEVA